MDALNVAMLVIGYIVSFSIVGAAAIVFIAWVVPLAVDIVSDAKRSWRSKNQ